MGLESLSEEITAQLGNNAPEIAVPDQETKGILRQWWDAYTPKKFSDIVFYSLSPGGYILWKLPEKAHKSFNKLLESLIPFALKTPQTAGAVGILAGASDIIYSLKPKKEKADSANTLIKGLAKTFANAKKLKTPEAKTLADNTQIFLEEHLLNSC